MFFMVKVNLSISFPPSALPSCVRFPKSFLIHIIRDPRDVILSRMKSDWGKDTSFAVHLAEHNVQLTIRRGILRFSLHMFNNEEDIDRVLDLAGQWRRTHNF